MLLVWTCWELRRFPFRVLHRVVAIQNREATQAAMGWDGNHGSIGDSRPIALLGCPRGHTVARET